MIINSSILLSDSFFHTHTFSQKFVYQLNLTSEYFEERKINRVTTFTSFSRPKVKLFHHSGR